MRVTKAHGGVCLGGVLLQALVAGSYLRMVNLVAGWPACVQLVVADHVVASVRLPRSATRTKAQRAALAEYYGLAAE